MRENKVTQNSEKTRKYHFLKDVSFFASLFTNIVFFLVFFFSGASAYAQELLSSGGAKPFLVLVFLYSSIFFAVLIFINFWFSFFENFILEKKFGLSKQNFRQWLWDYIKSSCVSWVIFEIFMCFFYVFLRHSGNMWWVYVGGVWFAISVLLARITPTVLIPLFYKYSQLKNQDVYSLIEEYFKSVNARIKKIYTVDFSRKTTKSNAFICGLGNNRRLVLSDTLVRDFTPEEILNVVAHEFAHLKHHDVVREIIISLFFTFTGLYFLSLFVKKMSLSYGLTIYMPYTLPLFAVAFIIFSFVVNPLQNFLFRNIEKQADVFSLRTVRNKEAFISMMNKLKDKNLAEFKPPLWKEIVFYTHPPIYKRIKLAEEFNYA